MTVGGPLGITFPLPSTSTTTNPSSTSTTPPTATSTLPPSTNLPVTSHYGGGTPPPSTQTCSQACAIAIPVVLLSLLTLGLAFAYFKYRHHKLPTRDAAVPLKSAIAAGSAPAKADPVAAGHGPDRGTYAQRVRGFFNRYEGPHRAGAGGESRGGKEFSTLRQSGRRDVWTEGDVDLEAGRELGHGRSGSVVSAGSETTLAEELAEGDSGVRKLEP
ncbi:hypothetical protein MMC17_005437 [Xylographa soralifera]|nr:hypothetical protein [Xylographa soralifera]